MQMHAEGDAGREAGTNYADSDDYDRKVAQALGLATSTPKASSATTSAPRSTAARPTRPARRSSVDLSAKPGTGTKPASEGLDSLREFGKTLAKRKPTTRDELQEKEADLQRLRDLAKSRPPKRVLTEALESTSKTVTRAVAASADAGNIPAAIENLAALAPHEAEDVLVRMLDDDLQPQRELLLAYKDGKLVAATAGMAKTSDDVKATAPLPKKEGTDQNMDLVDAVVTHTHPAGSPLSGGDIRVAINANVAEMRAVGSNGAFSMKRGPNGWGIDPEDAFGFYSQQGQRGWAPYAQTICSSLKLDKPANELPADTDSTVTKRGKTYAEDMFMSEHFACLALAQKFGWTYEHPDTEMLAKQRLALYELRELNKADERTGTKTDVTQSTKMQGLKEKGISSGANEV